ncbi:hypothetical protein [uncultured Sphingomonas sp.]|uniref:hypothetical protein n=1 Tax=uncultured Sphingomonas sp. TaxID=158754 RepID=UPI0025EDFFA0|nr:hypothetical protein [uncultured Sphingomonas sp.]
MLRRHAADAAIARYPGFGSSLDAAGEGDWRQQKNDLGNMRAAYLSIASKSRRTAA